jgi:hypothetical protein
VRPRRRGRRGGSDDVGELLGDDSDFAVAVSTTPPEVSTCLRSVTLGRQLTPAPTEPQFLYVIPAMS